MTSYGFLVAPALAQFSHEYFNTNFGTQGIGTQSAPQTITLVNDGGAPLHISSITMLGNNPSDFIINVGAAQNDCNSLGGVLPGGTQCNMSVYFQPQTTLDESAILTVTDDSSGVPGSQQLNPSPATVFRKLLSLPAAPVSGPSATATSACTRATTFLAPPPTWAGR